MRYALCAMRAGSAMRSRGFTYLALLAAIIILGISLTVVTKYWKNVMLREKEEELLFRGDQYVKAIESYRRPGGISPIGFQVRGPSSIDDLLSDPRSPGKRHLRRKYKDPITGEDFVEIYSVVPGQPKQLIGVRSSSDKEPLKQANFPKYSTYDYSSFEGKKKYSDWQFVYNAQGGPSQVPMIPGQIIQTSDQSNKQESSK